MKEVVRSRTEYGGFLPLELNPGHEWFEAYSDKLLRFNSVKASIDYLIRNKGIEKICIPYYYCPSTTKAIVKTGIIVTYYHIWEELMPENLPDKRDVAILFVDYFGVITEKIRRLADSYKNTTVIVDNAHAFYSQPLMKKNIYNLYSAKKFFGIPDGAYVIGANLEGSVQKNGSSEEYAGYLLITYERGTNAAYALKKEADEIIASSYGPMSTLSIGLLKNVDYERVRQQRIENYRILLNSFSDVNEIELPLDAVVYQFPLLISERGAETKKKLIDEKIFVSTLWLGENLLSNGNEFELNMSKNAIFIPVDQRYNEKDMHYIVYKIRGFLNENT